MYRSEKHCYRCQTTKAIGDYNRNRSKLDGRADACRECEREIARDRRARRKQLAATA